MGDIAGKRHIPRLQQKLDKARNRNDELQARLDAIRDILRASSIMQPRDALMRIYAALESHKENPDENA